MYVLRREQIYNSGATVTEILLDVIGSLVFRYS